MTSQYSENLPGCFKFSSFQEASLEEGDAVIVISDVEHLKVVDLPVEELERAQKMTHQASRELYLAGRYLLRGILADYLNMRPCDIPIALGRTGKPFLSQYDLYFSISHTERVVAAIFSKQPVGIDLEQERRLDLSALAQRFFSPEEVRFLEVSESTPDFFRLWCAREAAIKGDGRGLGQLLAETRVSVPWDSSVEFLSVHIQGREWSVLPWILRGGAHGAAAFLTRPRVIHWCDLRESLVC
jgi:phosphopantetheinyl transferase